MEYYDGEKGDEQAGHVVTSGLNGEFRIENVELKGLYKPGFSVLFLKRNPIPIGYSFIYSQI